MLTKSKGHVYPIFLRFPQPEDAAGADLQTRLLDAADVRFLFLIRVCGADGGEMALRRFQIAVDALAACRLQRLQLLLGQKSERAAEESFVSLLIRFTASTMEANCTGSLCPRPEVTMPKRSAP